MPNSSRAFEEEDQCSNCCCCCCCYTYPRGVLIYSHRASLPPLAHAPPLSLCTSLQHWTTTACCCRGRQQIVSTHLGVRSPLEKVSASTPAKTTLRGPPSSSFAMTTKPTTRTLYVLVFARLSPLSDHDQ